MLFVRLAATKKKNIFIEHGGGNLTDYKIITGHYVNVTGPSSVCQWTKFLQVLVYIYFADQRNGSGPAQSQLVHAAMGPYVKPCL